MSTKNKKQTWLVELAADGGHDSFVVTGSMDDLIAVVNKEAQDDFSREIKDEDEDYWDMYGCFHLDLEQAYIAITPIRRVLK